MFSPKRHLGSGICLAAAQQNGSGTGTYEPNAFEAIIAAGYKPGEHVSIALDPASSEFYDKASKKYVFKK